MPEKVLFPYRFKQGAVSLTVLKARVDGEDAEQYVDSPAHRVVLRSLDSWSRAVLGLHAEISPDKRAELYPDQERQSPPDELRVVMQCRATRWRSSMALQWSEESSAWEGEVELHNDLVRDNLSLHAVLVRTASMEEEAPRGYASSRHMRLATSPEWQVAFDASPSLPGGYLDVRWENFGECQDYAKLRQNPDLVYYVDFESSPPRLFLNEGVAGLREVLEHQGQRGPLAAIREVLFGFIAQIGWLSLATNSLLSIPEGMEDPEEEWQQTVLDSLRSSFEGHVHNLAEAVRDPAQAATLTETLGVAVQRREALRQPTEKMLNETAAT